MPTETPRLPMLAEVYDDYKHDLPSTIAIQPKYDGMRCIGSNEELLSRSNVLINSCPAIQIALTFLPGNWLVDGELIHPLGFQQTLSAVKRENPNVLSKEVVYYMFDLIDLDNPDMPFIERYNKLCNWHKEHEHECTKVVPTIFLYDAKTETYDFHHKAFVTAKFEGSIFRDYTSPYVFNKRSKSLLKRKDWEVDTFPIVDVISETKGHAGCAKFVCRLPDGTTFPTMLETDLEYRRKIYRNRNAYCKGYVATIKYKGLTDDGKPREPRAIDWRPQ